MSDAKQKILDAAAALGLTMTAEFVPFSQSRNKGEKHRSLNWRVTIKRMAMIDGAYKPGSERDLLTTDYSVGAAHCPSYEQAGYRSHIQSELVAWECENGRRARWAGHGVMGADGEPLIPDSADVLSSTTREGEISRILAELGRQVLSEQGPWILRDFNGNFVGKALVEQR